MGWLRNLWYRIKSLFSANAHAALDKAEDPVRMADQYIRQLEEQYRQVKQGVADSMGQAIRLQQKRDQSREEAEKWERSAMAALKKNDEQLARSALERKRSADSVAAQFAIQSETHDAQVAELRQSLTRLEQRLQEARNQREMIKVKAGRARSQEAISKTLRGSNASGSMFERLDAMSEKVDDRMYKAEAMAQLETDSLANRFEDLEQNASLDDELAQLKAKMTTE